MCDVCGVWYGVCSVYVICVGGMCVTCVCGM